MYELLFGTLNSLSLQTELLESCDWDEGLADGILASISLAVRMSDKPNDVIKNINMLLPPKASAEQRVIAKKIFEHEAKTIYAEIKSSGGIH